MCIIYILFKRIEVVLKKKKQDNTGDIVNQYKMSLSQENSNNNSNNQKHYDQAGMN